jgi:acetyl-CoA/propionyl-CoA carboxylase biotin carboxyl carrier protein
VIGSRFDPMLAKVIAHGETRDEALDRLTHALDDAVLLGLTTNLRFLRWLVREPAVRGGEMRIDTLARIWPPDDWAARATIPDLAWQAAARAFAAARPGSGWRLNAAPRIRIAAEGGAERSVVIEASAPSVGGAKVVRSGETAFVDVAGRSIAFRAAPAPDVDRAARHAASAHGTGPVELVAPMPGSIVAIRAGAGHAVDAGDAVVVLDAMKMEHAVASPIAGTVAEVRVRAGDQVSRGDVLAVVER